METVLLVAAGFVACLGVLGMQYLVCWFAYTRFVSRENERAGQLIRAFDPRNRKEQADIANGQAMVDDGTRDMEEQTNAIRSIRSKKWHQSSVPANHAAKGG